MNSSFARDRLFFTRREGGGYGFLRTLGKNFVCPSPSHRPRVASSFTHLFFQIVTPLSLMFYFFRVTSPRRSKSCIASYLSVTQTFSSQVSTRQMIYIPIYNSHNKMPIGYHIPSSHIARVSEDLSSSPIEYGC